MAAAHRNVMIKINLVKPCKICHRRDMEDRKENRGEDWYSEVRQSP
jgi:hypothetical protein